MPVYLLYFIQFKNFWLGRTTNERFSRKKPITPKERPNSHTESLDSTGSSLLAVIRQAKLSEDIIKEYGDPVDYSSSKFACILNQTTMCFKTTPPNQHKLYLELIKNQEEEMQVDLERSSFKTMNTMTKSPVGELYEAGSGSTKYDRNEIEEEAPLKLVSKLSKIKEESSKVSLN